MMEFYFYILPFDIIYILIFQAISYYHIIRLLFSILRNYQNLIFASISVVRELIKAVPGNVEDVFSTSTDVEYGVQEADVFDLCDLLSCGS